MQTPSLRATLTGAVALVVAAALVWGARDLDRRQQAEIQSIQDQTAAYQQQADARAASASAAAEAAADAAASAAARADAKAAAKFSAQTESTSPSASPTATAPVPAPSPTTTSAAPLGHRLAGEMTVPDINGALVTQVGGYPGQPLTDLTRAQLNKMGQLLKSLKNGQSYPCPKGSGGGFSDIAVGTRVTIDDGQGNTIATSSLTGGVLGIHGCTFIFDTEVSDADFYRVTIAQRGALTYSLADLEASGWKVLAHL